IGPIPLEEFTPESIARKIEANPFAREATNKKPRILTITQSTYDGVIYNVERLKEMLDGKIDTLHFDEAWLPHATFPDVYKDSHATGTHGPRATDSPIFSTLSIHERRAGLPQASQILVHDSEKEKLDQDAFNDAYLMHTSTTREYGSIALCDIAAAMME